MYFINKITLLKLSILPIFVALNCEINLFDYWDMTLEEIKQSIIERDNIDKNKKEGALKIAPDALYIDTSNLTIDKVCEIIFKQIS